MKQTRILSFLLALILALPPVYAAEAEEPEAGPEELVRAVLQTEPGCELALEDLRAAAPDVNVLYSFSHLFSGLSVAVPYGELEALRDLPGVTALWQAETYTAPAGLPQAAAETEGVKNEALLAAETARDKAEYRGQGTLIAMLDTGLDLTHSAFDPDAQVLGKTVLQKNAPELNQTFVYGTYLSEKIPFAYDYGDMDADVTDSSGHGTAAAGRAAGYDPDGSYSGVAPGAQLAIMKIYADGAETTTTDVILAALEDAYVLGADVIALSYGAPCGFSRDEALETAALGNAVKKLEEAGILVCCGAGETGSQAQANSSSPGQVLAGYTDYGTVASPASYEGVISSAAAINPYKLQYVLELGRDRLSYVTAPGQETALTESLGGQRFSYVMVGGNGAAADYEGLEAAGKIAVVQRGKSFATMAQTAAEAGAKALVVINNKNSSNISIFNPPIPVVMVSKEDGALLQAATLKSLYIPQTMLEVENPAAGGIAEASAWGTTPELTISPTISAIGSDVYGPENLGDYCYSSGTAMASAELAGACAALLSVEKANTAMDRRARGEMVRGLLYSTADPMGTEEAPVSVRQQGAGLVDLNQALETEAYLTNPLQALGDDDEETGTYTMELTVKNTALAGSGCPSSRFTDVKPSDWFHESVDNVIHEGMFQGTSETTFSPNDTLTRAQLVTVLYRQAGEPSVRVLESFSDVPLTSYYAHAVSWAKEQGIVNGVTSTSFAPNDPVTREQMVTILYRYQGDAQDTVSLRKYQDAGAVSSYAYTPMSWAVSRGIITSTSSSALYLSPKSPATRAQFAAIMTRFLEQNPVVATYEPYSLVMGDTAKPDKAGVQWNTMVSQPLDYDITFSCGDSLELRRWTEEVTLTVTIQLSGACRRQLRQAFPNGTYVEGFVGFREKDSEAELHSTFLAFFGDWAQAPILEPVDFRKVIQANYDLSSSGSSSSYFALLPMNTDANTAALLRTGGQEEQVLSLLGENPLEPQPYLADRCALSSGPDALAQTLQIGLYQLRNAGSVTLTIQDSDTGRYYQKKTWQNARKSLYSESEGCWQFARLFRWDGTDQQGKLLPNGTSVTISVSAALPGEKEHLEWQFSCAIDAQRPELSCRWNQEETGLTITARDDRYLAGILVLDSGGQILRQVSYGDNARAASHTLELSLAEIDGAVTVEAIDYASNVTRVTVDDPESAG